MQNIIGHIVNLNFYLSGIFRFARQCFRINKLSVSNEGTIETNFFKFIVFCSINHLGHFNFASESPIVSSKVIEIYRKAC